MIVELHMSHSVILSQTEMLLRLNAGIAGIIDRERCTG
jgi:hypothetical protein